jgi:hypothetical protein
MIKKKIIFLFIFFLFINAKADNQINEGVEKIADSLNIEVATKGKKLKEFFSGNIINLIFDDKELQYKFKENSYKIFDSNILIEEGKWKISGLLKNQIKLKAKDKKKSYYFKKIKSKNIIYLYNSSPGSENAKKTTLEIISSINGNIDNSQTSKIDQNKNNEKKTEDKLSKKKITKIEKKNNKKKKFKFEELKPKHEKKLAKFEEEAKTDIKIIKGNENEVHILYIGTDSFSALSWFAAAKHCGQFKKFAFAFWDSIKTGEILDQKKSEYYVCSSEPILLNPKTGSKIIWSNYDDISLYKYPDKHLYIFRDYPPIPPYRVSKYMKKYIKEVKAKDPNFFKKKKDKILTVYYKDEDQIHIKTALIDFNMKKPGLIAEEHCSKYNKNWYYSNSDWDKGKNGSSVFHCNKKTLHVSPLSGDYMGYSNDPNSQFNKQTSINNTNISSSSQNNNNNYNSSQLKIYNASSMTTFYFFESSHNFMSSLELLYRAYDENTKADELKAQINYNKQSKYTEAQKLKSTKSIIDTSSIQITANLQDASIVLSDLGRTYYQQALPYAYNAATNAYNLFMTVKNTKDNLTSSGDLLSGLLDNLGEVVGFATIAPEIPQFTRNMIDTSKLIFNGAKVKKIKDKGNLNKALDELTLD